MFDKYPLLLEAGDEQELALPGSGSPEGNAGYVPCTGLALKLAFREFCAYLCPVFKFERSFTVKKDIHPKYQITRVTCACGNTFETRSTVENLHVEICSNCHPFFTGKQKLVDSAGRVEKFLRKYGDRR